MWRACIIKLHTSWASTRSFGVESTKSTNWHNLVRLTDTGVPPKWTHAQWRSERCRTRPGWSGPSGVDNKQPSTTGCISSNPNKDFMSVQRLRDPLYSVLIILASWTHCPNFIQRFTKTSNTLRLTQLSSSIIRTYVLAFPQHLWAWWLKLNQLRTQYFEHIWQSCTPVAVDPSTQTSV
jgi:hypothetical protein